MNLLRLAMIWFVLFSFPFQIHAQTFQQQSLSIQEIEKIGAYGAGEGEDMRIRAQQEFGGRGPAIARHFLHYQLPPRNAAFFFLFEAIGDAETGGILIRALPDPPTPVDSVLPRYFGEIEVAIERVLGNNEVRADPVILETLRGTLAEARKLAWGEGPAVVLISLMGNLKTPEAAQALQTLLSDPDPAIRTAAVAALGETGLPETGGVLAERMQLDKSPSVRANAADAIVHTGGEGTVSSLRASLDKETDRQVIDSLLQSLARIGTISESPDVCLKLALKAWDSAIAKPFFNCWRKTASREALIGQAISGSFAVRALALQALIENLKSGPLTLDRVPDGNLPSFNETTRKKLLRSAVEVLSQPMPGSPQQEGISHETAYMTKEAFWEIAGRDMSLALGYVNYIKPLAGRYDYIGRFGASSYLASRNEAAYTAMRRPGQLLSAVLLALSFLPLLFWKKTRKLGAGLLAGVAFWTMTMSVEGGVHQFPPLPLGFLTIPAIAFLSAGLTGGAVDLMQARGWVKLILSPVIAGIAALVICGYTRSQGLYPIGSGGWELYFDPVGCALLAAPAAFIVALGLLWKPKGSQPNGTV